MTTRTPASVWIYTDADNTLWDTNSVYANAQVGLLSSAESIAERGDTKGDRLEFVRNFDQAIAMRHHSKLRYPPVLLIRALVLGLEGQTPEEAAMRVIAGGATPSQPEASAISKYETELARTPSLLPGVVSGLEVAASQRASVYIVTEGSVDSTRVRIKALGIDSYVSGTLSAVKSRELYLRLRERAAPWPAVMIGDQPDRDIRLSHAAGLLTVLVRSRFRPYWHSEDDAALADAVVDRYDEAITWILNNSETKTLTG